MSDSEEDDYLSMALPTDPTPKPLSSLAKRNAAQRDAADRARVKSKKELESERLLRLERGLRTDLTARNDDPDEPTTGFGSKNSKGAQMLSRLGYKGGALGKAPSAPWPPSEAASAGSRAGPKQEQGAGADTRLTEPIRVQPRAKNAGLGHATDEDPGLKRAREALDREADKIKRLKSEMGGYRERNVKESTDKRVEGQWWGAMRVCWTLKQQDLERGGKDGSEVKAGDVGVEWRAILYKEQGEKRKKEGQRERGRRFEREEEGVVEEEDKVAMGETVGELPTIAGPREEDEDEEMQEFLELEVGERLDRTVRYLREKWWYCFWCKARYDDKELDGCPGVTEDEHE
ncbi:hypothetical protein KVT40_008640 [Elsinoe batatas]|uniref:DUF4187 domain-containing protein n=1 Tax=Elsinoe batatas TaxID=2601811 RepID=A0A8K0KVT6_9PEZI|nr:hypothetical protein KVT40_008640 [Elsinoe batatas]